VQTQIADLRGAAGVLGFINNFRASFKWRSRGAAAFNGHRQTFPGDRLTNRSAREMRSGKNLAT